MVLKDRQDQLVLLARLARLSLVLRVSLDHKEFRVSLVLLALAESLGLQVLLGQQAYKEFRE